MRKEVHLRELADAGEEREPHVRVAVLDHSVQAAQEVAIGARQFPILQRVQDRLVVLVDQHHHALPGLPVQGADQVSEPLRCGLVAGSHARLDLNVIQLRRQVGVQIAVRREVAAAEAEPHHRMASRPSPALLDVQTREQLLAALEQLPQRVQEQALPEPPRTGQKVVLALVEQPLHVGRLVHVVAVQFAQFAEVLDAERQSAAGHGLILPCPDPKTKADGSSLCLQASRSQAALRHPGRVVA